MTTDPVAVADCVGAAAENYEGVPRAAPLQIPTQVHLRSYRCVE